MNPEKSYIRTKVTFDPSNPEHRKAYYDFLRDGRWGNKQSFECAGVGPLPTKMRALIIDWYLQQEFAN